jgi:hypothetical protein
MDRPPERPVSGRAPGGPTSPSSVSVGGDQRTFAAVWWPRVSRSADIVVKRAGGRDLTF